MNAQESQATVIAINKVLGCINEPDESAEITKEVAALALIALDELDETAIEILDDADMVFFAEVWKGEVSVWFDCKRVNGQSEILCSATREEWMEVRNALKPAKNWLYNSDVFGNCSAETSPDDLAALAAMPKSTGPIPVMRTQSPLSHTGWLMITSDEGLLEAWACEEEGDVLGVPIGISDRQIEEILKGNDDE